ncbi:MAG: hypothetical protein LBR10_00490 [Prevotellaceae bacterium]|jgi:hypothetical protein|nr:hypothetical protein [Prevotellaceae bacterium]
MKAYNKSILEYDDVVLTMDYAVERAEQRGAQKERTKYILKLFQNGFSAVRIAELTDLPVKEVNTIINKNICK